MSKRLYNDYNDFYVEEEIKKNICNEVISTTYYVKFARYNLFGMKSYKYFRLRIYGYYGYSDCIQHYKTKEDAVKKYSEYVKNIVTDKKITKHVVDQSICEIKLNENDPQSE